MKRSIFLLVWVFLLLVGAYTIATGQYKTDLSVFLPAKPNVEEQLLLEQLQNGAANRILLLAIEGENTKDLARLSKFFIEKLRRNSSIAYIHSGTNNYASDGGAVLLRYRYLLSPTTTSERFSAQGLRTAIEASIANLSSSVGMLSKQLFPMDPTGESLNLMDRLVPANGPITLDGQWFNSEGTRALLIIDLATDGMETDAQIDILAWMRTEFAKSKSTLTLENAKLEITGPASFAASSKEIIVSETEKLATIGSALILALLIYLLRSPRYILLSLLPVGSAVIAGITAVIWTFGSIHGLTIAFGISLIGESVDYAIYLFVQQAGRTTSAQAQSKQVESSASFWRTVKLGVLTSICGFGAMLFSGFDGLAQLGVFSIAGLLAAVVVARWGLPPFLPQKIHLPHLTKLSKFAQRLVPHSKLLNKAPLVLGALALILLMVRYEHLWNYELGGLSPVPAHLQEMDASIRSDLGGADLRYILVIKAPDPERLLRQCEQLSPHLQRLQAENHIGGYDSPCEVLPSQQKQMKRQAALPTAATLRNNLSQATSGLGLDSATLEPFIRDVEASKSLPLLNQKSYDGTPISTLLHSTFFQSEQGYTAIVQLKGRLENGQVQALDKAVLQARIGEVQALTASDTSFGVWLLDMKETSNGMYRSYMEKIILFSALGLVLIVVLLYWNLRSLRRVVFIVVPLLCAIFCVVAVLHLAGVKLSLLHIIGLLLTFAIGSNYTLFFSAECDDVTLTSLIFANLTTVSSYGVLAFSRTPVLQAVGVTVGLGTFLALLFAMNLGKAYDMGRKAG